MGNFLLQLNPAPTSKLKEDKMTCEICKEDVGMMLSVHKLVVHGVVE